MNSGRLWRTILAGCLWVPASGAQRVGTVPAVPSSRPPAASAVQTARGPATSSAFQSRAGRRDPFHNLIPPKKTEPPPPPPEPVHYPPGKRGLVIEQLALQGIARGIDGSWIAVVDNKTKIAFFLHEKDQLFNGVVSKINSDSIVFLESSNDTSGRTASHEVVKKLSGN